MIFCQSVDTEEWTAANIDATVFAGERCSPVIEDVEFYSEESG
jgi:hypothetical protein